MQLEFTTLDVFTKHRLAGNPLAVVQVPAAYKEKLSQAQKLKITQEFNLSETVFLHQPSDHDPKEIHIDIFCIESELPFAGHPTIGSAVLAKSILYPSVETLHTKAGPIHLQTSSESKTFVRAQIPHDVHIHSKTLADSIPADKYDSYPGLSHHQRAIRDAELSAPIVSIVKGMTFALVKLPSLDLLGQVGHTRLDFDALPKPILDPDWAPSFAARYYYVEEGVGSASDDEGKQVRKIRSRMVEMASEDPATGSAASSLTAYLCIAEASARASFLVVQGVEMGRRSEIHVQITADVEGPDGPKIRELWLGGEAVVVQQGTMEVDDL